MYWDHKKKSSLSLMWLIELQFSSATTVWARGLLFSPSSARSLASALPYDFTHSITKMLSESFTSWCKNIITIVWKVVYRSRSCCVVIILPSVAGPYSSFETMFTQLTRQTTYIPALTVATTSKVRSEHTQSLHYMIIRQLCKCVNCIPPIKLHFAKVDFASSRVISL